MNLLKSTIISLAVVAAGCSSALADATTEVTAQEKGYAVEVYECDGELQEIYTAERQVKNQGSVMRVCFRPNEKARMDGIKMKKVNTFEWEMDHAGGLASQRVVKKGKSDGVLSYLECEEGADVCFLDTLLGADFYKLKASVMGHGLASLTFGEPLPVEKWMFQATFNFKLLNAEGEEMSDEERKDFIQRYTEQQEAAGQEPPLVEVSSAETQTVGEPVDEPANEPAEEPTCDDVISEATA